MEPHDVLFILINGPSNGCDRLLDRLGDKQLILKHFKHTLCCCKEIKVPPLISKILSGTFHLTIQPMSIQVAFSAISVDLF